MNEHTPRRLKGSLLERAAEHFAYPPAMKPRAPRAKPADAARPDPAAPAPSFASQAGDAAAPPLELPVAAIVGADRMPDAADPAGRAAIDRDALAARGMIVPGGPATPLAEQFRMVKRQLLLTARAMAFTGDARARTILVCSAQPDDGKTFCAVNLALSMAAEEDFEILLVDADIAKPDVLATLGVPDGPGLLDVLAGAVADAESCIVATDVPNLSLLPAGTRHHNDTELLASKHARTILDGLAAAHPRRIVILDSPPALAASSASVLALHAGQVLLVVRADRTTESELREAVALFDRCERIQLVLNGVSFQPGGRRFGSYYEEPAL